MSDDMLSAVAGRFRALGEPVRLKLLESLCQGPKSVTELAELAGASHANTSKHLSVLAAAGFVLRRREGNRVVYATTDATPQQLCGVICQHVVKNAEAELRRIRGPA
jgi:ArsR family transcriptional regulator